MTLSIDQPQSTISHNNDGDYAYQDIVFTTPKTSASVIYTTTGIYEFNIQFDHGQQNGTSFSATGGVTTFATLLSFLNGYFASLPIFAHAIMHNGGLRIIGPTRGPQAMVRADDSNSVYVDRLFTDMDDFDSIVLGHGTPLAAYQEVLLSVPHLDDDVAIAAGAYSFDVTINGITSFVTVTLTNPTTYLDLINAINNTNQLSNGWIEYFRDRFIIHSFIGGPGTSVLIGADTLFSAVTDFSAYGTPVPGEASQLEVPYITMQPSSSVNLGSTPNAIPNGNIDIEAGITALNGGHVGILGGSVAFATPVTGAEGGYVEIRGGTGAVGSGGDNAGGYIFVSAGDSEGVASGADVQLAAGANLDAGNGGNVYLFGGFSETALAGEVIITGGGTTSGTPGRIGLHTGNPIVPRLEIFGDGSWWVEGTAGVAGQVLVSQGAGTPPLWAAAPSPIAAMIVGTPPPSGIVLNFVAVSAFTIPDDFAGSQAASQIAATGSTTFDVKHDGVTFGTINFAAAASVGTFTTSAGAEVFAAGDILTIVAPVIVDASLADIGITIVTT